MTRTAALPTTRHQRVSAPRMFLDGIVHEDGYVAMENGRFTDVRYASPGPAICDIELTSGTLTPGLLDLQNNGAFGVDWATAEPAQWQPVLAELAKRGVTGVQPTLVTAPLPELHQSFAWSAAAVDAAAGQPVAQVVGIHLEGPYISPVHKGAHQISMMRLPSAEEVSALLADPDVRRSLRTLTLAPELPGALEAIDALRAAGVLVSVGHSDATAEQVKLAADHGATMVTHLFNAQRPFAHRDPGVPGAALCDERLFVGLIIDGLHVDPLACQLVFRAAVGRVVAVTDSILTAGLPAGTELTFAGDRVSNDENGLGHRSDGTIAGAGIVLDEGVRRMVRAGLSLAEVLTATTETPARSLGRNDIGALRVGARADLVWWDDDLVPRRVWVGGVEID